MLFEYYKFSNLTVIGGDSNTALNPLVMYETLSPSYVDILDSSCKHNACYNWYFWFFASPVPAEYSIDASKVCRTTGNVAASASTSDTRLKDLMALPNQWSQVDGANTSNPNDDTFDIKAK